MDTFFVPWVVIWTLLFALWWRAEQLRRPTAWSMLALAILSFFGGAVASVLPFGFLPFDPEQSPDHYLAHAVCGVAQLPLTILLLSPNPPKDTDGRREGSGRGWVRELQGRWPGLLG